MHPNEVIMNLKPVNQEAARCLKEYRIIQLSRHPASRPRAGAHKAVVHVATQAWPSQLFVAHWGRPTPWRPLSLQQRRRLLSLAANSGCAASLEAALAHCGCSLTHDVAEAAVLGGSVAAVETLLIREGCDGTTLLEEVAAQAGHLAVVQWLRQARRAQLLPPPLTVQQPEDQVPQDLATAVAACRGGHRHIITWLQEQQELEQPQEGAAAAAAAAAEPGLQVLARPEAVQRLATAAAAGGHVGLLYQLLPRLKPIPTGDGHSVMLAAAQGCPLEVLQHVCSHVCSGAPELSPRLNHDMAFAAASSPTPDWEAKLDWALQQTQHGPLSGRHEAALVPGAGSSLEDAAGVLPGWLQRLQALRARRVPLPPLPVLARRAAAVGDVVALGWLLEAQQGEGQGEEVGMEDGEALATSAALGGHVRVLEALRERGCRFSREHVDTARQAGRVEAMAWLLEQPLQPRLSEYWQHFWCLTENVSGELGHLRYLYERHGAYLNLDLITKQCSVEALEWAVMQLKGDKAAGRGPGLTYAESALGAAAQAGNLAVAHRLRELLTAAAPTFDQLTSWRGESPKTFCTIRCWLRLRQRGGLTTDAEDRDWKLALACVARAAFAGRGRWGWGWLCTRAQWKWLVARRLEAAAEAEAAGREGAVALARLEVEDLERKVMAADDY
ncbi:hypothetical protein HYH02_012322 [Chlamydomonas schloesseri]|uniref:Uncharacterized protein n=1 Tax=Chlamydomonas schloesseri TaxID=2026947 RepID=A0A835TAA8_9CHLO|nr:hypothetical protein HYH02_012322 [Chlamydomonas schloesseri]|eukprot:KAG2434496.1 hypothetical protein HYH02_012322 [Chlamydomonas schloesseri]